MLEPGFYPHGPDSVELRDTHISWVFLADELAYKVKKPVVFPFLDYGTLRRRHQMCREEVRLNRRLAPQIYLRVVGIIRAVGHYSLAPEDDNAVEYAVEMRRVNEERSLAALAVRQKLGPVHVEAVARRLARFHAEVAPAPAQARDVGRLVAALKENLTTLREAGSALLPQPRLDAAERFTWRFLSARRAELEARARDGLVRECHGDLRAEHVIVPVGGEVYVYDCVEFNPGFRHIDVGADISFLVMDLSRLGAEALSVQLIDDYRKAGGNPGDRSLLSFFASYRAWVRAKIACLRALDLDDEGLERRRERAEADEFLGLGHRFAWRARQPLVLLVCGIASTGKTTLARELALISGWPHISSDLIRKRIAGLAPTERASSEHYSREFTLRTYSELGRAAHDALRRGRGVIVDATFHRRSERGAFRRGLGDRQAPLLFVECRAPREVLLDRIRRRELEPGGISDADAEVMLRQLAEFEPLEEVPAVARTELVTEARPIELVAEVEDFVDRSLWGDA